MSTLLDFSTGMAKGAGGNTLSGSQIVDSITSGTPILTHLNVGAAFELNFANYGDIGHRLLLNEDCSLSLKGGNTGELQTLYLFIQQPYEGNCEITWPSNIIWAKAPVFVDSRIGSVCCVKIVWDGATTYYGGLIFG